MTKNRLPINLNPDITSYVQHAYTTAIIDNNRKRLIKECLI